MQISPDNPPAAWFWRPPEEILGSTLKVRVGGSFIFPPSSTVDVSRLRRVVFLAGGVGVNPLMSMLSYIAENKQQLEHIEVLFAYATKTPSEGIGKILFLSRITDLYSGNKVRGSIHIFATGQKRVSISEFKTSQVKGADVNVYDRRISCDDLAGLVGESKESVVYICGPQEMTDEFVFFLTSTEGLNMDSARVLKEKWW